MSVVPAGQPVDGLPVYTMVDVGQHATMDDRIWVTYGHGVYDITDFVEQHPGGDKILMAAGGSLEPFWLLYGVHKNPTVFALLEKWRIGMYLITPEEQYYTVHIKCQGLLEAFV